MSRVAKLPVSFGKDVTITLSENHVVIKGKKGQETHKLDKSVAVNLEDGSLKVVPKNDSAEANMQAGTARSIINSLVHGVTNGYEIKLVLVGVGFKAQAQGKVVNLTLGYSHPVTFNVPEGISAETPSATEIILKGTNKETVGETAAKIRAFRSPDPYKGKGIRYANEVIILKETKKK